MALSAGIYAVGSEFYGVWKGKRYGPMAQVDLDSVLLGHPERVVTGQDAEVSALPASSWSSFAEANPGVPAWVMVPWAPIDLIPPASRAAVLANDETIRPTVAQWVAHVDHGAPLPTPQPAHGGGATITLPAWLGGATVSRNLVIGGALAVAVLAYLVLKD